MRHFNGRNDRFYLTKRVAYSRDLIIRVGVEEINAESHYDDGHQRTGYFARYFRREGDYGDTGQSHQCGEPVGCVEVAEINHPFRNEIAGYLSGDAQSEEIFDLRGEYRQGYTAGESHHDGIGDELDDSAQPEHA